MSFRLRALGLACALAVPISAVSQQGVEHQHSTDSTMAEIERYRQMLADGNPGELWEVKGEHMFKEKRGPKQASLEKCDFGLGPGVTKGAYAQLPRYFADVDRVMDLEARLVHCMVELQGFKREDITKRSFAFSTPDKESDMEALVTYIAGESNGVKINVPMKHPKEIEAYKIGEALFYRRGSYYDFSCVTCHSEDNKRIRLQDLPNIRNPKNIQATMTGWPTYRVSQGTVRTMQHRLWDCGWQMRNPDIEYTSDAVIALHTFLSANANGGVIKVPSIKR